MEIACQSELAFSAPPTTATPITGDSVHRVTSASKHGGRKRFSKMEKRESFKKGECYRCGNDHEAQSFPYKNSVCHKCNKMGHLARQGHSGQKNQPHQRKQTVTFVRAEPEMGVYTGYTCNAGGAKPIYVIVELCGKQRTYPSHWGCNIGVKYDDQTAQFSAFVIKGDKTPLLGRDWLKVLKQTGPTSSLLHEVRAIP